MKTLKERLDHVMDVMGWDHADLVRVSGQSSSVVSQWRGRGSKEIKTIGKMEAAVAIGNASGFVPLWIAKGIGRAREPADGPARVSPPVPGHPPMRHPPKPHRGSTLGIEPISIPDELPWELLMQGGPLPERFRMRMPDDALSGYLNQGTGMIFERDERPSPGKTVLIEDGDGGRHVRRYVQVRGAHWRAAATGVGYAELDSERDGLRVLATMRWREE